MQKHIQEMTTYVSILVLVEYGLKVFLGHRVSLSKIVSILVLVEYGLKESNFISNTKMICSFNPCFSGIRS